LKVTIRIQHWWVDYLAEGKIPTKEKDAERTYEVKSEINKIIERERQRATNKRPDYVSNTCA